MKRTLRLAVLAAGTVATLAVTGSTHAGLIISQYYEGASSDKYIELFNAGDTDIDLGAASFKVGTWSNANREGWKSNAGPTSSSDLTGMLAAGESLLLKNGSATNPTYAASAATTSNAVTFNGDDSVVLYTGSTFSTANVVDAFGVTSNSFVDKSFVRSSSVLTGTTSDFDPNDWIEVTLAEVASAASTSAAYLGFHEVDVVPIPEPLAAGAAGLLGLVALRRRRMA